VRRLRPLSEDECRARLYGAADRVRVVSLLPRRRDADQRLTGEALRALFEARLDARPPTEDAEAA
jgi:hypothetical protein